MDGEVENQPKGKAYFTERKLSPSLPWNEPVGEL